MLTAPRRKVLQNTPYAIEVREWMGSKPVGREPCPLDYLKATGSYSSKYINKGALNDGAAYEAQDYRTEPETYNKCYARFIDKFSTASQQAVNFAERESAMKMVATRASQMLKSYRALKKGRLGDAAAALGISGSKRPKNRWSRPKDASNLWLELHFGWVPMCQDIKAAIDLYTKDLPDFPIKASARRVTSTVSPVKVDQWAENGVRVYRCRMGADIRVTNPNSYYANQLGLLNPFSVAYELIPFSFVVDWFTSVGQVINSLSDFAGVEMVNSYTTESYTGQVTIQMLNSGGSTDLITTHGIRVRRTLGIRRPALIVKTFEGLSLVRGATAIALLLQAFKN